ncbi:MAG TPA: hypothetical protein VKA46_16945 [Gemmataceae bacterium]|nr:hypothetical protein [Gemmataceae bacterium]
MTLHHFVTYNRQTGEITGHFLSSTTEFLPKPLSPGDANLQVSEQGHLDLLQAARSRATPASGAFRVTGRVAAGKVAELSVVPVFGGRVHLATHPAPRHGAGRAEIPADGASVIQITATIQDNAGQPLAHAPHAGSHHKVPATISFRTDHGALSRRTAEVVNGRALVELRSVAETVRARVTASAKGFQPGAVTIEFIPPEEFEASEKGRREPHG